MLHCNQQTIYFNYLAHGRSAKYCDQHVCMFVCCSCICMSVHSHIKKPYVQIAPDFLYMLPMTMAWSSSDGNAMCSVSPDLWMTSCFHVMGRIGHNQSMLCPVRQMAAPEVKSAITDCIFWKGKILRNSYLSLFWAWAKFWLMPSSKSDIQIRKFWP